MVHQQEKEIKFDPLAHQAFGSEKAEVEYVENLNLGADAAAVTLEGHGLLKSRFDEMSLGKTLWTFRRVVIITLAVYTGYMCEGFEVSDFEDTLSKAILICSKQLGAGGSIVANAGFIREFGEGGSGVRALNPTWCELKSRPSTNTYAN